MVQALRRIKTGTSNDLQPLKYIRQLPQDPTKPPKLRFAYIVIKTKESPDGKFLKFIADSDYEEIDRNQNGDIEVLSISTWEMLPMAIFANTSKNKDSADNSIHTAISLIKVLLRFLIRNHEKGILA